MDINEIIRQVTEEICSKYGAQTQTPAASDGYTPADMAKYIDHTYLKPEASVNEIRKICDEAKKYHCASVCVNPSYIQYVAQQLEGSGVTPCCVIAFPFGTSTPEAKAFEASDAASKGAREIDMVINLEPWNDNTVYDRLGLDQMQTEVLGVKLPSITIPVKPGRNLASIVEVAAMNNRNRKMGHNAALELTQRMDRHFEQNSMSEEPDEED
mgnify:CR=1 FL=1